VDFLRLGKDARFAVNIPVHFKNQDTAPGVKAGGVMNIVSHSVPLFCSADLIPDEVMVDAGSLQIGQSIHLSQIELPKGVSSASHDDVTLCTVTAKTAEEEAAAAPASAEVPATNQKAPAAAAAGGKGAPAKGAAPAKAAAPAPKKK
jgi:large subunit ribosomal protein L25